MGGKQSKKMVPNRPPPKVSKEGGKPVRMVPQRRRMVAPDGGWGWLVVLGACISLFFFPSVTVAYGVMFKSHLEGLGAGATVFTIIGNGLSTFWSFSALFMAPLAELFSARSLTFLGGLTAFLTMILLAFSTNIITFTVVYTVLGGISCSLCTFFGLVLIPKYFDKRKGLANGFVVTTSAMGKIVMAPLIRLFLEEFGYRWACLLVGALSFHTCISGMLYQPAEWHLIPDPEESEEKELEVRHSSISATVTETENRTGMKEHARQREQPGTRQQTGKRERALSTSAVSSTSVNEDDEENIIFTLPATPQLPSPTHRDDEVVLFSRAAAAETQAKNSHPNLKLKIMRMDSVASLYGSLPILTPVEEKQIYDDDDDDDDEGTCCSEFFLIKMFRLLDYSLLKDPYFHLIAWPGALSLAAYINVMYALPGYVISLGFTHYQGAFAISVFSSLEVVFRMSLSFISDYPWFPDEVVYTLGYILTTLSVGVLSWVPSYEWILIWIAVKGMAISMITINNIHIIVRYLGVERYAQVIGFSSLFNGVMILLVGTIAGLLRDHMGSYTISFQWLTVVCGLSAGVWVVWLTFKAMRGKYYNKVPSHIA